jgi:hypothetical protein
MNLTALSVNPGLILGRRAGTVADKDETYYPQFDQKIREEAAQMAEHYEIFYCLEKSIRTLINDTLKAEIGTTWWDSGRVPSSIHTGVAKRIR